MNKRILKNTFFSKRLKIKNSIPFSNISKHIRYYAEFFQNSILASKRAVFERDIIFFLAKIISEASGPMEVHPIWPFEEILFNHEM